MPCGDGTQCRLVSPETARRPMSLGFSWCLRILGRCWPDAPGGAGMVAVRVADLVCPAGMGGRRWPRPGPGKIRTGRLAFCKPVASPRRWCAATGECRPTGIPPWPRPRCRRFATRNSAPGPGRYWLCPGRNWLAAAQAEGDLATSAEPAALLDGLALHRLIDPAGSRTQAAGRVCGSPAGTAAAHRRSSKRSSRAGRRRHRMCLPCRQERLLRCADRVLSRSDPHLASMLSIFARLSAGERMPGREQLRPPPDRVLLRPVAAAAFLVVFAAGGGASAARRAATACGAASRRCARRGPGNPDGVAVRGHPARCPTGPAAPMTTG